MLRNAVVSLALAVADGCTSDLDCSLNGVCSSGACRCDEPWTGSSCGVFEVASATQAGIYGFSPNISSWGGGVVAGDDGKLHLYVAEIPGGLRSWSSHSQCAHAVADTLDGPFERQDTVLGAECHGPVPVHSPVDNEYLLFHIGQGPDGQSSTSGIMHHSSSTAGPWTPAKASPGDCNMPSAAFHPNGTLFLMCSQGRFITSTPTWDGEWQPQRSIGHPATPGDSQRKWEDPNLWFDRRGNFHILYHVYCLQPFSAHKECFSGHAFSSDGLDWTFSDVEPFGGRVDFTDGTSVTYATRERPQLVFADKARTMPMGVITSVSSQPVGPMCESCTQGACSQCKVTEGRDWTYTVLQPFANYATKPFVV